MSENTRSTNVGGSAKGSRNAKNGNPEICTCCLDIEGNILKINEIGSNGKIVKGVIVESLKSDKDIISIPVNNVSREDFDNMKSNLKAKQEKQEKALSKEQVMEQ